MDLDPPNTPHHTHLDSPQMSYITGSERYCSYLVQGTVLSGEHSHPHHPTRYHPVLQMGNRTEVETSLPMATQHGKGRI